MGLFCASSSTLENFAAVDGEERRSLNEKFGPKGKEGVDEKVQEGEERPERMETERVHPIILFISEDFHFLFHSDPFIFTLVMSQ